jgi:type I site-specific restriction endonuclease
MIDLREIRANRIGITFKEKLQRDPFVFASNGLLLRMLYAITRPGVKTTRNLRPVELFVQRPTFVGYRGEQWGNDVVEGELKG